MPMNFRGLNLTAPINRLGAGFAAMCQNVRAYFKGGFALRNLLTDAIVTVADAIETICRLNDTTPLGPAGGFTYVIASGAKIYVGATGTPSAIADGFNTDPVSMIPFRPNASVRPWVYIAGAAPSPTGPLMYVTITTEFAIDGTPTTFVCASMLKVESDGLIYKMGIKEPQVSPTVSTAGTTTTGTDNLPATTIPWTNAGGANPSYNYDQTTGGTAPVVIVTPAGAQSLTLVVTQVGSPIVNGAVHAPGDVGPTGTGPHGNGYPANFTGAGPTIVVGAFTDGSGNVLTGTSPVPLLANVGAGITLQVPAGAAQFQIGIDSEGDQFSANSAFGSGNYYSVAWTLVTSAIATVISTLGNVTTYYWGDSPHSGPVASYIWKNPNDTGTGIPKTIGTANGTVTNNSWMFDSSPEDGSVPLLWDTLDSSGTITGSIPVFDPQLESEGYEDFNMCVVGTIFVPAAGTYQFTFVNKDQIMVGIGGGATVSGGYVNGPNGQTESVVSALPLVYVSVANGLGTQVFQTIDITFPGPGSYQVEIDYDYWYHSGRCLYMLLGTVVALPPLTANIIPPLPSGVRTGVSYGCKYRNSQTGAVSNPGPTSAPQVTPVLDNTVTCPYSDDPQVDKVDYYRQDSGLANYTYVATGPNTNPPTPITDTLTDLEADDNQIMDTDDFEPFPSIDTPKAGVVNVSGNVITWVSGDQFNTRWLAGTIIEIGSPTQLAYSAVCRPSSATSWSFVDSPTSIPDGTNLIYNIPEPILAAQPLAYLFGPTDNINYTFGVGDPLRPGTLYWCKGSNLDSAPDTNQMDVTDPSEPLVNGAMSFGLGVVFSIRRAWIIEPNFYNATATAQGVSGTTWSLQATQISRGLFIPRCIAVAGGGTIFFRVDDGIHASVGGLSSKSITDETLYSLFSHEGSAPAPITRHGVIIYPPDDTHPQAQQFTFQNGYLYYDYGYDFSGTIVTDVSFVPEDAANAGDGVPWQNPVGALVSVSPSSATITSWSVSGGVMTFIADNNFTSGEPVTFAAMVAGSFLNSITLVVISAGLSSTQFSVDFPYPDTGSTADSGNATPAIPDYASLNLPNPPFAPNAGEYIAYSLPTSALSPESGFTTFAGAKASIAAASWIAGGECSTVNAGTPDTPFLAEVNCGWSGFTVPTLPVGAVITRIFPVVVMTNVDTASGIYVTLSAGVGVSEVWNVGAVNGQNSAPSPAYSLGSADSDITGAYVNLNLTARTGPWPGGANISSVLLAIYYTVGSGAPPANQAQTLELTGTGLAIPSGAVVTGIQMNFASGLAFGGASDETVQLTVSGSPVGSSKSINPGAWPSPYLLGGSGDLWGQGSMSGAQANNLGANFSSGLNSGSQLNLNDVSLTVYYETSVEEEGNATLVFDLAAMGWILDGYAGAQPTTHAPNEGESQQGILAGCSDGTVRMLASGGSESVTGKVLSSAIGGSGWQHLKEYTLEYSSNSSITVTPVVADEGNGSYAPPAIILPSTGGATTKLHGLWGPNKFKLMQFETVIVNDLTAQVYLDGFSVQKKDWGSSEAYQPVNPFSEQGGFGGQL